jgi:hypothetical protein
MTALSELLRIDPPIVVVERPEYRIDPPIAPVSMLMASLPDAVPALIDTPVVGVGIDVVIVTSLAAVPTGVVAGGTGPPSPPSPPPQETINTVAMRAKTRELANFTRLNRFIFVSLPPH